MQAYNMHHNLVIRPEDVWFAILSQLSLYINKNLKELRDHFVSHKGKKELIVKTIGTRFTVDFGYLAKQMTILIGRNVVDPKLRQWIMPDFSTTKDTDRVIGAILMMGAKQKYFSYRMCCMCGIPSVTLLGTKED